MALILLDLDGTILLKGEVQKGIVETIKKLQENKHEVAIATGRSPVFLNDYDKLLGVKHLILSNGAYVSYNGEVIYQHTIPEHLVKKIIKLSDEMEFDLSLVYEDDYRAYRKETENVDIFSEIFKIIKPELDHNFHPDMPVLMMQVFDDNVVKILRREIPELIYNKSNRYGYDVNLDSNLKADGAKFLIDYLNLDKNDVYAFGDGINDVSMIKLAGHGVAMGNACKELKEVAEYVTTNVDDDGVINALKHYKLI